MTITTQEQWNQMTDRQRYEALTRAEMQRANAEHLLRELNGTAAAERQQQIVDAIRGKKGAHAHARN
jgi:hypothetical protein